MELLQKVLFLLKTSGTTATYLNFSKFVTECKAGFQLD